LQDKERYNFHYNWFFYYQVLSINKDKIIL